MKAVIVWFGKILLLFLLPLSGFGQEENSDWWLLPSPGSGERQIPDWFLNPEPDEYVGVSLPSCALEASALFSALMSYCAREETEAHRKDERVGIGKEGELQILRYGGLNINERIGMFEVSRKFLNEYNELFVAVKIRKDDSVSFGLRSFWENDSVTVNGVLKRCENNNRRYGGYFDRINRKFIGCEYTDKNGDCHIVMQDAFTKEVFNSNSHYSYQNKKNASQTGKSRKQFSCRQSLGLAYLQAMWALIEKQKEVEEVKREESAGSSGFLENDVSIVILKKLDYSVAVEDNNLIFTIH